MRLYNPSGYYYSTSSYYRGPLSFKNIVSGVPATHSVIWYTAPPSLDTCNNLTTSTIAASGIRANLFSSPIYPCKLKAVGTRITAALTTNPPASGCFALYTNTGYSNDTSSERVFYPGTKLWQSEPFYCGDTGIYIRYPDVPLESSAVYWLVWIGTRNSTMYNVGNAGAINIYGNGAVGGTTETLGIAQTTYFSVTNNFVGDLPNVYPAAGANVTSNVPMLFYMLGQ